MSVTLATNPNIDSVIYGRYVTTFTPDRYVYIAWASDSDGTDFTETFDNTLNYIAILTSPTIIVNRVSGNFDGLWKKYSNAGLYLNADKPVIAIPCDLDGSSQDYTNAIVTFSVINQGTDDTANWTFTKVDGADVTSAFVDNVLTISALTADTANIAITATDDNSVEYDMTYTISILKVRDGIAGIGVLASPSTIVIPCDPAGANPVYTNAISTISVFLTTTDDTANWTFSKQSETDVTAAIQNDNEIAVSAIAEDEGSVTVRATKATYDSIDIIIPVKKWKGGNIVPDGTTIVESSGTISATDGLIGTSGTGGFMIGGASNTNAANYSAIIGNTNTLTASNANILILGNNCTFYTGTSSSSILLVSGGIDNNATLSKSISIGGESLYGTIHQSLVCCSSDVGADIKNSLVFNNSIGGLRAYGATIAHNSILSDYHGCFGYVASDLNPEYPTKASTYGSLIVGSQNICFGKKFVSLTGAALKPNTDCERVFGCAAFSYYGASSPDPRGTAQVSEFHVTGWVENTDSVILQVGGGKSVLWSDLLYPHIYIEPDSAYSFEIMLIAAVGTTSGSGTYGQIYTNKYTGVIKNLAGTTSIVGSVTAGTPVSDAAILSAVAVTADDTNDRLQIECTAESAYYDIRISAYVKTVKIAWYATLL